jgi:hypothetical protein
MSRRRSEGRSLCPCVRRGARHHPARREHLHDAFGALFPAAADPTAGVCDSCEEFVVGSDFIKKIEARGPALGVVYTNIATEYDELVSPYTSSFLSGPNVTNILEQDHCALDFADHLSIISNPITGRYILDALDPAHAQRVPCVLVAPALSGASSGWSPNPAFTERPAR